MDTYATCVPSSRSRETQDVVHFPQPAALFFAQNRLRDGETMGAFRGYD